MTDGRNKNFARFRAVAPVCLTLLLLGGTLVDKVIFHLPPADAAPYHARVQRAVAEVPYNVGPWIGTDTEVPPAAVALLRPNLIVSREYRDVRTGRSASFLIVQCEDARDLLGHYPPVCYAAHGWSKREAVATARTVSGEILPVTDYVFTSKRIDRTSDLRIMNFMILPDGQVCRDMETVETAAQDYQRKFFGAAQVQVITDSQWSDSDREDLFNQLVGAAMPLIREIRSGVTR